jgi:hypothetical protein
MATLDARLRACAHCSRHFRTLKDRLKDIKGRQAYDAFARNRKENPMNGPFQIMMRPHSIASAVAAVLAIASTSSFAEYKCDRPQSMVDQRACAKAAQGPDALRQFIYRTRMIYGLYIWDYSLPEEQGANAAGGADGTSVAVKPSGAAQAATR